MAMVYAGLLNQTMSSSNLLKARLAAMIVMSTALSACLSDDPDSQESLDLASVVNSPPSISGSPDTSATVGEAYNFTPIATDDDGDELLFAISNRPDWATFDSSTGILNGVPETDGTWPDVLISVSDGQAESGLAPFSIVVTNSSFTQPTNTAPTISGTPPELITVGEQYKFLPAAEDDDGDALIFSAENLPDWAWLNSANGRIGGVPTEAAMWPAISLYVSDGLVRSQLGPFEIQVIEETMENTAPTISGIPQSSVEAGSEYEFTPNASDADGDPLEFSIQNRPGWASFDRSTGALLGTPNTVGDWANIRISVSDGIESASLPGFTISVTSAPIGNTPPEISGSPPTTVEIGQQYSFAPSASDADGDNLSFSIQNRPGWTSFDTKTGVLQGTPGTTGNWSNIRISVSDGTAFTSLPGFAISVTSQPIPNTPPTIGGTPATTIATGDQYTFTPSANDADGDPLEFFISNRPSWASFNQNTGRLSGTPDNAGTWSDIRISVSDGNDTANLPAFNITAVAPSNRPPQISGSPDTVAVVGQSYQFAPSASDPDGDTLTYSIENQPSWASFSTVTGLLSGVPGSPGTWSSIRISVTDGSASDSLASFEIIVQSGSGQETIAGVPEAYDLWLEEAQSYGQYWAQRLDPNSGASTDSRLGWQYYDAQWVFFQIGDYLGQSEPWRTYGDYANIVYVDEYLEPSGFRAQGFRRFPHGLLEDFFRGGQTTYNEIIKVRDNPAFSSIYEYRNSYNGVCESMSRELAYALQANVAAERAGAPRVTEDGIVRVEQFVEWIEIHFYQWMQGNYGVYQQDCAGAAESFRFAPFMAGLHMHALIELYEWERSNGRNINALWTGNHWSTFESMIDEFLTWLRNDATVRSGSLSGQPMWVSESATESALRYEDRNDTTVAWDLNNLIAPAYAWNALRHARKGTAAGDVSAIAYIDSGDRLFNGSATRAYFDGNQKQFNQAYRWSFKFIEWRNALVRQIN